MNKECDISDLIRYAMTNKEAPRNLAPVRGLYPSSQFVKVGGVSYGRCPRETYYNNTCPDKKKENFRLNGMALMGEQAEEVLVEMLKKAGLLITTQLQVVDTEYYFSGKIDAVSYAYTFNGFNKRTDIVVDYSLFIPTEVKSIYGYNNKKLIIAGNQSTVPEPKPNGVMQLALYVDFLQRNDYPTPYGVLWYIMRDEGESKSYKLTIVPRATAEGTKRFIYIDNQSYHNFTIEDIIKYNLKTKDYIEQGIEPKREFTLQYNKATLSRMAQHGQLSKVDAEKVKADRYVEKGDIECNYCAFKDHCYREVGRGDTYVKERLYADESDSFWETT